jgi:hypothetical protein
VLAAARGGAAGCAGGVGPLGWSRGVLGACRPPAGAGGLSQGWFCCSLGACRVKGPADEAVWSLSRGGAGPLTRQVRVFHPFLYEHLFAIGLIWCPWTGSNCSQRATKP